MAARTRAAVLVFLVAAGCGGGSPTTPGSGDIVTGTERFGWDQPAADAGELATFRYALYVDDVRGEAANVSCEAASSGGRFACVSSLPSMSTGAHVLQVAAFVIDAGVVRESTRSTSVRVVKR